MAAAPGIVMGPSQRGQMRCPTSRQASAFGHPRAPAAVFASLRQTVPQKRWHSLCSGPSIWHGPTPVLQAPRLCSTRPAAATDHVVASQEAATTSEWTKVLWVGNIPREMEVEAAEAALRQAYPAAQHVEVVGFASSTQRSSYPKGCLHRGFALVVVHHPDEAPAAAQAILGTPLGPEPLLAQPALKAPEEWPAEYTLHGEALEQHKRREAERERLRGHRKRNWQRQLAAYQQQLGEILGALPDPGGLQVARAYQHLAPVLQQHDADAGSNSSSSEGSSAGSTAASVPEPAASQQASSAGPVASPRSTYHLVHWPSMPAACDTIVGGNLAMHGNLGQVLSAGGSSTGSNSRTRSRSSGLDAGQQQQEMQEEQPVPARTLRKRLQVESFLLLLLQMLKPSHVPSCQDAAALKAHIQHLALQAELSNSPGSTGGADGTDHMPIQQYRQYKGYQFVEFGCGTGNLVLPLARLLPGCQFHAIDMKWRSVELLEQRAKAAGLSNLTAAVGRIEQYGGPCDVALALHACGSASDYSLLQAARCRAAYLVSPCCVGKLQASLAAAEARGSGSSSSDGNSEPGLRLVHPRSRWMVGGMASLPLAESFRALAQAADYSHTDNHGHPELAALCKSNIELDRSMAALEDGYSTALVKLLQPELTTKSDVLVGAPAERIGQDFSWWWQ